MEYYNVLARNNIYGDSSHLGFGSTYVQAITSLLTSGQVDIWRVSCMYNTGGLRVTRINRT